MTGNLRSTFTPKVCRSQPECSITSWTVTTPPTQSLSDSASRVAQHSPSPAWKVPSAVTASPGFTTTSVTLSCPLTLVSSAADAVMIHVRLYKHYVVCSQSVNRKKYETTVTMTENEFQGSIAPCNACTVRATVGPSSHTADAAQRALVGVAGRAFAAPDGRVARSQVSALRLAPRVCQASE